MSIDGIKKMYYFFLFILFNVFFKNTKNINYGKNFKYNLIIIYNN